MATSMTSTALRAISARAVCTRICRRARAAVNPLERRHRTAASLLRHLQSTIVVSTCLGLWARHTSHVSTSSTVRKPKYELHLLKVLLLHTCFTLPAAGLWASGKQLNMSQEIVPDIFFVSVCVLFRVCVCVLCTALQSSVRFQVPRR